MLDRSVAETHSSVAAPDRVGGDTFSLLPVRSSDNSGASERRRSVVTASHGASAQSRPLRIAFPHDAQLPLPSVGKDTISTKVDFG